MDLLNLAFEFCRQETSLYTLKGSFLPTLLAEKRLEDALILIYANKQVSKIHPLKII